MADPIPPPMAVRNKRPVNIADLSASLSSATVRAAEVAVADLRLADEPESEEEEEEEEEEVDEDEEDLEEKDVVYGIDDEAASDRSTPDNALQNFQRKRSSRKYKSAQKLLKKLTKKHAKLRTKSRDSFLSPEEQRHKWEEEQRRLADVYLNEILPAWSKKKSSAKVRSMFFKGVPASVRGKVWLKAAGNRAKLGKDEYQLLLEQAQHERQMWFRQRDAIDKADGDLGAAGGRAEETLLGQMSVHKAIMLDLPRTYPDLNIFHSESSPYRQHLMDVLGAFTCFRPEIGYSQGMSFVVALLLLYMEPQDAFRCFVNMLPSSCFLDFYTMKMPEVKIYMIVHERLLKEELPSLYKQFKRLDVRPEMYMVKWIMCLFCQSLPLEATSRVWDVYFLDGDVIIFRAAIGILKLLAPTLMDSSFEEVATLLSHLPKAIDEDDLLKSIRSVHTVTSRRVRELVKQCREVMCTE